MVFDSLTTFEMNINPILFTNVLVTLTESLMVWNYNVRFWANGTGNSFVVIVPSLICVRGCRSQFNSVDGPIWIMTTVEGLM